MTAKILKAIIHIRGGVAETIRKDKGIELIIFDWDDAEASDEETSTYVWGANEEVSQ